MFLTNCIVSCLAFLAALSGAASESFIAFVSCALVGGSVRAGDYAHTTICFAMLWLSLVCVSFERDVYVKALLPARQVKQTAIAPKERRERTQHTSTRCVLGWLREAKQMKQKMRKCAQCAVTYIGVETTHIREIPFSRFERQAGSRNGAMAGLSLIISRHIYWVA